MSLTTYATVAAFRQRQGIAPTDTADDARILAKLRAASRQIDRYTGRTFAPVRATRRFSWISRHTLLFNADLLALTQVTNGDGTIIDPSAITVLGGTNGAIFGITLDPSRAMFNYSASRHNAIQVEGIWGWHDEYANAWRGSNDQLDLNATAGSNLLAVFDVYGSDAWGNTPRFSAGQLIRINQEYMSIISVEEFTSFVVRGANGTTIATRLANSPISIYTPPTDIQEITLRWAAWLYAMDDAAAYNATYPADNLTVQGIDAPPHIPSDLIALLHPLRRIAATA